MGGEDYLERIGSYKREVYILGKKIEDFAEHPNIKPTIKAVAYTYELGKRYLIDGVFVLNKELRGPEDLIKRYEFQREASIRLATCNYRCTGCDAINSLFPVTKALDKRLGTDYHSRFLKLLREIQEKGLACTAALTDPKGDRSKRPLEQPDMFVRIVEKKSNGIVVSGAKVHQSGAFAADVNFFLPTQSFKEGEEAFAVAFAVLPDDSGVKYILQNTGVQAKQREGGEFEFGNPFGDRTTCMIILDNVFIPEDRVFILGDLEATRQLLSYFGTSHRCASAACKAGFLDAMAGAASLMMKLSGLSKVPALQQKLTEIIAASEISFSVAVGAAVKGFDVEDIWMPNQLAANAAKFYGVELFNRSLMNLIDISGGIIGTSPSEFDLRGQIGSLVSRYLSTDANAEERMKIVKFIEYWVTSSHLIGAVHGGGSPLATLATLRSLANVEERESAVKSLLGLK